MATHCNKELAECYFQGRGYERDFMKAAKLGNSKATLELGMREKEEKESECLR